MEKGEYYLCYDKKEFVQSSTIVISLYILVIFICFTMLLMILKYSSNNMIFRERSGKSLYIQLISTSLFLLLYPFLILIKQGDTTYTFMEFQFIIFFLAIFKYIPIFVYFLRSLRFYLAFNISFSIDGILFKMLRNTQSSVLIIIVIPTVLIGIIETQEQFDQNLFLIKDPEFNQIQHTRLIMRYFSQALLICSSYLLRKSKKIFIYDYWSALFIEGMAQLFKTILFNFDLNYCYNSKHPLALYYFIDCLKLVFFLITTISVPFLTNHKPIADLPFEMQCTNFNFFFNESKFVKIFYQYLCHFDFKKNTLNETVCASNFPNQINKTIIHEKNTSQQIFNYQLSKCYLLLIDLTKFYSHLNHPRHSIQNDLIVYFSQPEVQAELQLVFPIKITKHLFNQINILKRMKQNSELSGGLASSGGTDEEDSISNIKLFDLGWQLREIMFEQIRTTFEQEFKYTTSFKNLLFMCEQNRIIWQRLGKMNLSGK